MSNELEFKLRIEKLKCLLTYFIKTEKFKKERVRSDQKITLRRFKTELPKASNKMRNETSKIFNFFAIKKKNLKSFFVMSGNYHEVEGNESVSVVLTPG